MAKNTKNNANVILSAQVADAVMNMFTSKNGVNISPILNDLGADKAKGIIAGLLMNGAEFNVDPIRYRVSTSTYYKSDIYLRVLRVNRVSWLLDTVYYAENGVERTCSISDWNEYIDDYDFAYGKYEKAVAAWNEKKPEDPITESQAEDRPVEE